MWFLKFQQKQKMMIRWSIPETERDRVRQKNTSHQKKKKKIVLTSTSDKCPAIIRKGWILSIDQILAVRSCEELAK